MEIIKKMAIAGFLVIVASVTVHARPKEYIRDYSYQIQSYDTRATARVQALDGVRSGLLEELGVYIQSVVEIKQDQLGNSYMSNDVVALSAGIVAMTVLQDEWRQVDYYVKAQMQADPDDVLESVKRLHKNYDLEDMLRTSQKELEDARKEVAQMRRQLENSGDKKDYFDAVQTLEMEQLFQQSMRAYIRGDFSKSLQLLQELAKQGNIKAQGRLGLMYERGIGIQQNYDKAREWYNRAIKSSSGFALARRGFMYERGLGELQNYTQAVNYYHRAIEQGNASAYAHLGFLYFNGKGVDKDYDNAHLHFKKSADEGSYLGMAWLGFSYEEGIGVERDHEKAFKWTERAAKKGNPHGLATLGKQYLRGRGTEQDFDKALKLLRSAELRGSPLGTALLGYMYERGLSELDQDNVEAIVLYRRAAKEGSIFANVRLARCYWLGIGVGEDQDKAIRMLSAVADMGPKRLKFILRNIKSNPMWRWYDLYLEK
ncbi:MAG: sel1 repeat family protein [Gammaproteobacteria bacterium]|nr:sel1 repeat family protein [Gammaproteobacteria bacterium]